MGKKIRFSQLGGFIEFNYIFENADIIDLEVLEESRRQGIATKLILEMEIFLKQNDITSVFLEVRKTNEPAIKLYEKLNFEVIDVRKDYYSKPACDAIVMRKNLTL
jgi:ribosomal-protein-alanine N-acetyltransferase